MDASRTAFLDYTPTGIDFSQFEWQNGKATAPATLRSWPTASDAGQKGRSATRRIFDVQRRPYGCFVRSVSVLERPAILWASQEGCMKRACVLVFGLGVLSLLISFSAISATSNAAGETKTSAKAGAEVSAATEAKEIASRTADVNGVKIHYLTAGHGPAVILLHGYTQTSRMWRPIIPLLAEKFTVIAPDLPGIGDSEIPADGLDMKTAAFRVHALAKSLGVEKARVVGHDIGLMVAYAYTAQFPAETEKLVVMDAFLPGVAGWEGVYNDPSIWHFRFNGPTPEALVRGRERTYFEHFWNDFAANKAHSIPEADRVAYTAAYSRPGRMRAGWAYFVSFQQAAKDFAELSKTKLTMPVLAIGGEKANGTLLGQQMKIVATDAKMIVLKDTGHWVMEERPKETTDALIKFL
jgi:pimeloyl-ACP methyl ester carboxylesterase